MKIQLTKVKTLIQMKMRTKHRVKNYLFLEKKKKNQKNLKATKKSLNQKKNQNQQIANNLHYPIPKKNFQKKKILKKNQKIKLKKINC